MKPKQIITANLFWSLLCTIDLALNFRVSMTHFFPKRHEVDIGKLRQIKLYHFNTLTVFVGIYF